MKSIRFIAVLGIVFIVSSLPPLSARADTWQVAYQEDFEDGQA